MNRLCVVCGKVLVGKQKKTCSEKCRKQLRKDYNRKYRQNNQERIKEQQRDYRQNNLEKERRRQHEWYQNNIEKRRDYNREYRQNNLERAKEYDYKYRQNNQEKIKERGHEYYQINQEKIKTYSRERGSDYYQNNRENLLEYGRRRYRRIRGLPEDCDLLKESGIEKIMRGWLEEFGIKFEQQYFINLENSTWTHVDFYIPEANICLYVDGDYWHSLSEVQERDIRINKILEEMGYRVIRMTETEILEEN